MSNYEKDYIGKGKKHETLDIISVSIEMEKAEKHITEFKGKKYLNFEVATMKEKDKYEKTHTAYVSVKKD